MSILRIQESSMEAVFIFFFNHGTSHEDDKILGVLRVLLFIFFFYISMMHFWFIKGKICCLLGLALQIKWEVLLLTGH